MADVATPSHCSLRTLRGGIDESMVRHAVDKWDVVWMDTLLTVGWLVRHVRVLVRSLMGGEG